ncbi:MAG: FxsA family protein [Aestuariivita sp.]|nr:FxsA family protein [Aestuariivita sp.]
MFVPLIEIALFIEIGGLIGLWSTLLIVTLTAMIGTLLLRQQGFMVLRQFNEASKELKNPLNPIIDAVMILIAGVFLLTPGFFTDAVGFSFLIPSFRHLVFQHVFFKFFNDHSHNHSTNYSANDDIIDADFEEIDLPDHSSRTSGWKND